MKNLNIEFEKAMNVIKTLEKYNVITATQIEMDDINQEIYKFSPTPAFIAFLIFTHEMIDTPRSFSWYIGGRNKPYLT